MKKQAQTKQQTSKTPHPTDDKHAINSCEGNDYLNRYQGKKSNKKYSIIGKPKNKNTIKKKTAYTITPHGDNNYLNYYQPTGSKTLWKINFKNLNAFKDLT